VLVSNYCSEQNGVHMPSTRVHVAAYIFEKIWHVAVFGSMTHDLILHQASAIIMLQEQIKQTNMNVP